ncbi:MAG: hypothetical protein EXR98_09530 [Gemmataceae bacterium]|nr:hypothetical protein [Gemmataceae bacterium]
MVDQIKNLISDCDKTLSHLRAIDLGSRWNVGGQSSGDAVVQVRGWLEDLTATAARIDVAEAPPSPPTLAELYVGGMTTKRGVPMAIGYVQKLRCWGTSLPLNGNLPEAENKSHQAEAEAKGEAANPAFLLGAPLDEQAPAGKSGNGPAEVTGKREETEKNGKGRRPRGRPRGSDSAAKDLKLYLDWKAANRATKITKAEFVRERGLPATAVDAIERGRAQDKRRSGQK